MAVHIDYLADHPSTAATLARWHHAEWGRLLVDWSLAQAEAELRAHTARRAIPTTLVALDGGEPVGSVSLLENDDARIRRWSPWLASLYVLPERRGEGLGERLVRRAVEEAAGLGVPELFLYTTDAMGVRGFYEALGWRERDRVVLHAVEAVVLAIRPEEAS